MKISEVCAKTGLTDRAIRFYIEKGLLEKTAENINGRNCREYTEEDILQLNRISALRKAGFSIQDILEMKQGPEAVREVMESHSRKLEGEAASYISIAKELKSIHVGGGVSWQKLADVFLADGEIRALNIELQWPEEADTVSGSKKESAWKRRMTWLKKGLTISVICLSFGMILAGMVYTWKRELDEKKKEALMINWYRTALSDVSFEEVWRTGDQMYASIYGDTWPYSLSENFDEPVTIKLDSDVDERSIVTAEGITYVSVELCVDIPYSVAEVFDVIYVDEVGFMGLNWEKLLKHRNLVENYCTVVDVDYDNNIREKRPGE